MNWGFDWCNRKAGEKIFFREIRFLLQKIDESGKVIKKVCCCVFKFTY